MTDAAPRVPHEEVSGQATVLQMFDNVNRQNDTVAGCRVTEGTINAGAPQAHMQASDRTSVGMLL